MKHRVNVTGILKANGQMAYYGEVLDDSELVNPETSIKDGFTVDNDAFEKAAKTKKADTPAAETASDDLLAAAAKGAKKTDTPAE